MLSIDHEKVKSSYEGNPVFVGYLALFGGLNPMATYFVEKPNREKGHKDYLLIFSKYDPFTEKSNIFVSGVDLKDISERDRKRVAVFCRNCKELIYSLTRHSFEKCTCGAEFVDGGADYLRSRPCAETHEVDLLSTKEIEISD